MKSIYTLKQDIYDLVKRKDGWFTDGLAEQYAKSLAKKVQDHWGTTGGSKRAGLRLSRMGDTCLKSLWHSVHTPELAEAIPAWAEIKYSFGHAIEALAIVLAKASGHTVTGEQDELILDGIVGHRDCVIDGCVVDVKSSSSRGMDKFKRKTIAQDDAFGYLYQLDGYVVASRNDPLVTVKDRGYILAIDKQLGHIELYEHYTREESIKERIRYYSDVINRSGPPACTCETVPHGRSGNIALGTRASYNPYKHCCWPRLRTFLYADGPVYLTHVERVPDVPEIYRSIG